jgi:hypothetical protein
MLLDVDVRVPQVVSAWCLSRQHPKKMELTTAFESENVVDGNVYAYTLTITKYWLDGRTRRYDALKGECCQCRVADGVQRRSIWPYTQFYNSEKYVISLTTVNLDCQWSDLSKTARLPRYKPQSRDYRVGVARQTQIRVSMSITTH